MPRQYAVGDIVVVWFPFTNLSKVKKRPALILGQNSEGDYIIAFIGKAGGPVPPNALLIHNGHSEFRKTNLREESIVRLDKIMTLVARLIVDTDANPIGRIGPVIGAEVARKLYATLNIRGFQNFHS